MTWDARITSLADDPVSATAAAVAADSDVADISTGYAGFPMTVGALHVDGIAMAPDQGPTLMPTPVEGRAPAAPGEVMLGGATMAALHTHIGGTIDAEVAAASPAPVPLTVVGRAVFPSLSDAMGLGKGVAMTPDGLRHMVPDGAAPPPDTILVRFRPGVAAGPATEELNRRVAALGVFAALAPERPVDLVNFGRVQRLPLVLGGLLGAFAAATLAHLLVSSIRRRRRDLAVLKTLGLSSGQTRATVAWQSTTLAAVAVVVGVPLGVAAGRTVWTLFARQLGIQPVPVTPLGSLAVLAAAAVLVANVVAVLPGRVAGRTRAAAVLRSE